ncbi:MAG: hypothetical protein ACTS43_00320 [Candidatus Hodgkinia cicadicola]
MLTRLQMKQFANYESDYAFVSLVASGMIALNIIIIFKTFSFKLINEIKLLASNNESDKCDELDSISSFAVIKLI